MKLQTTLDLKVPHLYETLEIVNNFESTETLP